ncbi:MAG TPA: SPOR domain-containing protein [Spirochaetes bacterium]|nr:SPOR domain-containing protein [Spirochaetota bacterium]
MQNMDFHTRKQARSYPPHFDSQDPEYFSRLTNAYHNETERGRKKANRIMSLIIGLCIISFTLGIVIGIKFASGSKTAIVDENTKNAVSDIGKKVSSILNEKAEAREKPDTTEGETEKKLFPRGEYPFVVRVGSEFDRDKSYEIANFLSGKGHTVILSKSSHLYRVFVGPFKTQKDAEISLKKISAYSNKAWSGNACILKR